VGNAAVEYEDAFWDSSWDYLEILGYRFFCKSVGRRKTSVDKKKVLSGSGGQFNPLRREPIQVTFTVHVWTAQQLRAYSDVLARTINIQLDKEAANRGVKLVHPALAQLHITTFYFKDATMLSRRSASEPATAEWSFLEVRPLAPAAALPIILADASGATLPRTSNEAASAAGDAAGTRTE
jgi:hypothetical protein